MQCAGWATKSVAVFVDTFSSTGHIRLTQLSISAWFCRCFTDLSPEPADLVSAEFLWAALDCPGAFAFPEPAQGAVLLGELQVALLGDVSVDERCVLVAYEVPITVASTTRPRHCSVRRGPVLALGSAFGSRLTKPLQRATSNKVLQLMWHSSAQSIRGTVRHLTQVLQRLSAACATQLSAGSVRCHGATRG